MKKVSLFFHIWDSIQFDVNLCIDYVGERTWEVGEGVCHVM